MLNSRLTACMIFLLFLCCMFVSGAGNFQLYLKNKSEKLDPELFANPSNEYRGPLSGDGTAGWIVISFFLKSMLSKRWALVDSTCMRVLKSTLSIWVTNFYNW